MQKKTAVDTKELLAAVNKIYKSNLKMSDMPSVTEEQKILITKFTLKKVNHLANSLLQRIRLDTL
ncbi:hypothetical protein OAR93_03575 [Pelagibacteraceae bacterium]|jgi:hypothetical protein|nr:hypothetical protein [Pelagibacteraceae bacterium]